MEYSINIKSFGAIPDGITDCSSVFQRAADTLTNGGIFYIPAGTYRLHHTVRFSHDHITIIGEGRLSHIIFDYAQKDQDTPSDASAFAFTEGIRDVTVRDLKIEYEGCFYPNANESYLGKSSGLCFVQCFDVLVEHCEISGFNANGIKIATGDSNKYAEHVKVDKCYLHHNRVAGVLFGYVDCICISNCDLDYHGSPLDGGTGYGCAGFSGEYPRNVQIVNNRSRYNYRKGLDLHAGVQAIIEGNICDGNRLYGIYTEGPKSGDVVIRGNIITGMEWENTGFPHPYEWIHGISVGAWGSSLYESDHFNYMVAENEIRGFGLETQDAYPFYVYGNLKNGAFLFKNNYIQCGRIQQILRVSYHPGAFELGTPDFDFSGNSINARKIEREAIDLGNFKSLMMSGNRIYAEDYQKQQAMDLCRGQGTAMITSNLLDLPGCTHIAENFAGKLLENTNYINNTPAVR